MTGSIKNNYTKLILAILITTIIIVVIPYEFSMNQKILLGALIFTIYSWTTNVIPQLYASIFILVIFTVFGKTPLEEVFKFPLSPNFIMISLSFLLSRGVVNSSIIRSVGDRILDRYSKSPASLIWICYLINFLFIFIIPQPFARTVILASILAEYLKKFDLTSEQRQIILLSLFVSSASTGLALLNGDIILNGAAIDIGHISFNEIQWIKWMLIPTTVTGAIINYVYIYIFKKQIDVKLKLLPNNTKLITPELTAKNEFIFNKDKLTLTIIILTIGLWMFEPVHKIPSSIIAIIGTTIMYMLKILRIKDIREINLKLIIFLTAAFSIGSVMSNNNITEVLFSNINIDNYLYSIWLLPLIALINMMVHVLLGSSITTLSITIPTLLDVTKEVINPIAIVLISNIAVSLHYILPFHRVVLSIGSGKEYYSNDKVIKIGLALSALVPLSIIFIYIPWWKIMNLI